MAIPQLKILAVDFDGTVVKYEYPKVGPDVPHAASVLRRLYEADVRIILYTMRHDELAAAIEWFMAHEIPLWAVNENPEQISWTESRKVYAHHYVDDAAIGCPLIYPQYSRPYVDWIAVERQLRKLGYFPTEGTIAEIKREPDPLEAEAKRIIEGAKLRPVATTEVVKNSLHRFANHVGVKRRENGGKLGLRKRKALLNSGESD